MPALKRYVNVNKHLAKATPSLRAAFWTMIITSSVYWILAMILGGLLLTSCSGSIFSDGKKAEHKEPPTQPEEEREAKRNPPPGSLIEEDGDGPGRDIVVRPRTKPEGEKGTVLPDAPGRSVVDVASLDIFDFLFPRNIDKLSARRSRAERKDIIAKLRMEIVIAAPTEEQEDQAAKLGYAIRTVTFYLKDGVNTDIAKCSADMDVSQDNIEGAKRSMMLNGFVQNRDDKKTVYVGLSLRFRNQKFDAGDFIKYTNKKPHELPLSSGENRNFDIILK